MDWPQNLPVFYISCEGAFAFVLTTSQRRMSLLNSGLIAQIQKNELIVTGNSNTM